MLDRVNAIYGPVVGERVLLRESFLPAEYLRSGPQNLGVGTNVAGHAADVVRNRAARDRFMESATGARTCAERFPTVATCMAVTPTRIALTDIHHVSGRPSMVIAEYRFDEVVSIEKKPGSVMNRWSRINFSDKTSVALASPRGGAYAPHRFRPIFNEMLADLRSSAN